MLNENKTLVVQTISSIFNQLEFKKIPEFFHSNYHLSKNASLECDNIAKIEDFLTFIRNNHSSLIFSVFDYVVDKDCVVAITNCYCSEEDYSRKVFSGFLLFRLIRDKIYECDVFLDKVC